LVIPISINHNLILTSSYKKIEKDELPGVDDDDGGAYDEE